VGRSGVSNATGAGQLTSLSAQTGQERTLSWITKCRRLDHDYERLTKTSAAMVKWAMVGVMTRRLAPTPGRQPWTTQ